jgi:hypothetical protein
MNAFAWKGADRKSASDGRIGDGFFSLELHKISILDPRKKYFLIRPKDRRKKYFFGLVIANREKKGKGQSPLFLTRGNYTKCKFCSV